MAVMRTRLAVLLSLLAAGCSSAAALKPPADDRSNTMATSAATAVASDEEPPRCQPAPDDSTLGTAAADKRLQALVALDRGDAVQAQRLLGQVLEDHPGNRATVALHGSAEATIQQSRQRASQRVLAVEPLRVGLVPLGYVLGSAIAVAGSESPAIGNMRSTRNALVDAAEWQKRIGVRLPSVSHAALPPHIPKRMGHRALRKAIDHGDHHVVIYGASLLMVLRSDGALVQFVDASLLARGPREMPVRWAQARDGVLYVLNAHMGYARDSNQKNGFVSAIDLADGRLRWRSRSLVANSTNFLLRGAHIIAGYGFTAEKDALHVLDRSTGTVVQAIPLGSRPAIILERDGKLHVHGHGSDWSFDFDFTTGPEPGPVEGRNEPLLRLDLQSLAGVFEPSSDEICRRRAALIHLDRGRPDRAVAALWHLSRSYKTTPAMTALRDLAIQAQSGAFDLQRDPLRVDRPAFEQTTGPHPALPATSPPRLVEISTKRNQITDDSRWLRDHGANYPARRVPRHRDPGELPTAVPVRYGVHDITTALQHDDQWALIYAGRIVAIVDDGRAVTVLDLQHFIDPPRVRAAAHARFARQPVTWAEMRDGVVYVANGGGSYAREVYGKKGFVSAIDAKTGKLLWRSAPLVCNANFIIKGSHIITGYGFTSEPDHLFVIDRANGKTVSRQRIASGPSHLVEAAGKLFVRTYDTDYIFELR